MLYLYLDRLYLLVLLIIFAVVMSIVSALSIAGYKLIVLAGLFNTVTSVKEVFNVMRIDYTQEGVVFILDRSGIKTKVLSVGFVSMISMVGGKKSARNYLVSVIKKFINYRFIKENE